MNAKHMNSKGFSKILNQNGGTRTETLVKLVLIFVISLLSFAVGTFVGKQFSDSQYKMASLEKEFNVEDRGTASVDGAENTKAEDPEGALTDEDIANLTKEFVDAEKDELAKNAEERKMEEARVAEEAESKSQMADMAMDMTDKKPTANSAPPQKNQEVSREAQRVAANLAPSPDRKVTKRIPTSLPTTITSSTLGKYTVQVASYALETDAKSHTQRLKEKGFSAFYLEAKIKGKKWFRVSVGLFDSRRNATKFRKSFMSQANVSSAIVSKIVK